MRWSKLKQLVEDRMAESLQRRVEVHSAQYRIMRDEYGRGWVTMDKGELANFADTDFYIQQGQIGHEITAGVVAYDAQFADDDRRHCMPRGTAMLHSRGIYSGWEFSRALWDSLSLSIDDALQSDNMIIRAFAMLDSRLGKRRLRALHLADDEHPLVRQFYDLRCEAEGIGTQSISA